MTNYHRTEACEVEIHVPLEASVEEWDALTGTHKTVEAVTGQGQIVFRHGWKRRLRACFSWRKWRKTPKNQLAQV